MSASRALGVERLHECFACAANTGLPLRLRLDGRPALERCGNVHAATATGPVITVRFSDDGRVPAWHDDRLGRVPLTRPVARAVR